MRLHFIVIVVVVYISINNQQDTIKTLSSYLENSIIHKDNQFQNLTTWWFYENLY
jgi:hypothetical protein